MPTKSSTILAFFVFCAAAVSAHGQGRLDAGASGDGGRTAGPYVTASAARDGLRVIALSLARGIRLEVVSQTGETVYDSGFRAGNRIDWRPGEQSGDALADGIYGCLASVEGLDGRISYRRGTFRVRGGEATFDGPRKGGTPGTAAAEEEGESLTVLAADGPSPFTLLSHDGREGWVESATGALNLSAGTASRGRDGMPQLRLTPEGNLGIGVAEPQAKLDVAGTIRASGGFQFSDGTVLRMQDGFAVLVTEGSAKEPGGKSRPAGSGAGTRALAGAGGQTVRVLAANSGAADRVFGLEGSAPLYNTFYGLAAGDVTTGGLNAFFGNSAGAANTTGYGNSFFGRLAGTANINGFDNSFFGVSAGAANISGKENSFFGSLAGASNTTGEFNSFFGGVSGYKNTTGNFNSFFGEAAGYGNTTGYNNSFFGLNAGTANTIGFNNSFFGRDSGAYNTEGNYNSFFGHTAGLLNTTGSFNSFFGREAGYSNTAGAENAFFGNAAGRTNTTGVRNAFFGHAAGNQNTTGDDNAFFGWASGYQNTLGFSNSFFGKDSGAANTTGNSNSFFGDHAGYLTSTGSFNAFVGRNAGRSNNTGYSGSFVGESAGYFNTTGHDNSFVGRLAGYYNNTGSENSSLGSWAGSNNTSGGGNTAVGSHAGLTNTIENNNSFIGAYSTGAVGITNATAVGYAARVTQSNSLVLGSINGVNSATADTSVGIGITAPERRLHVAETGTIATRGVTFDQYSADTFASVFLLRKSRNATPGSHTILQNGDALFNFTGQGSDGTKFVDTARIRMEVDGTPGVSDMPGRMSFWTTPDGAAATVERMRIDSNGNVGIGTTAPAEKLHVVGNIRYSGTLINAAPEEPIPDYVFEPDYPLMSLEELGHFVEREKHLPNVPSASEIKANGLNIGEFQMKLLEKIEELALYTVQQARTIKDQQGQLHDQKREMNRKDAEIGRLNSRIDALEQAVERLAGQPGSR